MTRPRIALITGSCRRLGAHIAARLAEAGYDIALHASHHPTPEDWLTGRISAADREWKAFACDLSKGGDVEMLVDRVSASFGAPVALLVNNASFFDAREDGLPGMAALEAHFRINMFAPAALATAVARQDGGGGAAVVNILDQRIAQPHRDQIAYTLSKQALAEATRTLAIAMAPCVRVNAVAPGLTLPTPDYGDAQLARLAQAMPLGRLPTPEQVAEAVVYLAEAEACTGQTLFVDGGAAQTGFRRDFVHLER
ncbi:SDR family oxidoreductase [Sphingomonas sp.]